MHSGGGFWFLLGGLLAAVGSATPAWLTPLEDDLVGSWRIFRDDDTEVKIELRTKSEDIVTQMPLRTPTTEGNERLERASGTRLEGAKGKFRVKTMCGQKVAWLSWTELKLDYVNRYVGRETKLIELFCGVVESAERSALVVDLGANHGLYGLAAGAKGASVVAVEAQRSLAWLLDAAATVNDVDVRFYHNAILDTEDFNANVTEVDIPEMAEFHRSEGGTAAVGRVVARVPSHTAVTVPAHVVVPPSTPAISFLKIDVEGVELAALRSAMPLFAARRVSHAAVEFGPVSRWTALTKDTGLRRIDVHAARAVLAEIRSFGYRTLVGGANVVHLHSLCGGHPPKKPAIVAGCPTLPPHRTPLAEITSDKHLATVLAANSELTLFIDRRNSTSSDDAVVVPGGGPQRPRREDVMEVQRHRRRR